MNQTQARTRVVITVPHSRPGPLRPDEEISLRHLRRHLATYDKILIVPQSLTLGFDLPDFRVVRFGDNFFGSVANYNRMLMSRSYYERFEDYEFMLNYHFDALVFSDQMEHWCREGWDYIAPPWINCADAPWVRTPGVGNGGFSLRRISSFLKVFDSHALAVDPEADWAHYRSVHSSLRCLAMLPRRYLRRHWRFNGIHTEIRSYLRGGQNEDMFFGEQSVKYVPEFRLATFEEGVKFAWELEPARMYELNNRQLPFGCHAFGRYDRAFWEPFMLKE